MQRRRRLVVYDDESERACDGRTELHRRAGGAPNSGGGTLRLDLSFNTCSYASGDEAAVQAILQYYGLSGIDTYTERITLPNTTRCAVVGLAMPGKG